MRVAVLLAAVTSAVGLLCGCDKPTPPAPQIPEVTVSKPLRKTVEDYDYFTGRMESVDSIDIRARVKGFLKSADFEDGQSVKEGALLFVIEREPFETELKAATATAQQTQAAVKLAEANLSRAKTLQEQSAITREELQTREAERDAALARLAGNMADIDQATIDLNYTVVRSPIDGKMGRRLVDPGNLVGADGNTLLSTIVSMDQMNVYFDVPERIIHSLLKKIQKQGAGSLKERSYPVFLGFPEEEAYPIEGTIDFLDNRVDPTTGTAIVRGLFDNDSGLLYSGRFVRLRIPRNPIDDAILVDERAVGTDLGGKYVLVVGPDNIVEQKHVELGPEENGMRVVLKGLTGDETYVVKGIQRARPGRPVQPQQASATPPAEKPAAEPAPTTDSEGEAASG